MDSIIYDKPLIKRLNQKLGPVDHITNAHIDIGLQKKIKKRNKKLLQDPEIRKLCSDYQNEVNYLWNSDPERQGKEVDDSGEVDELNRLWQRNAVRRDLKKGLIRVSSGRPVYWSEPLGKWIEITEENRRNLR